MSQDPTLIIQMQRMGDLVLSFPLMAWLLNMEPQRPVWVVAEPRFYKALMPFAPPVVFFNAEEAAGLRNTHFHRVINLSHRPAARDLTGLVSADARFGSFSSAQGMRIQGNWHVYRASIVHNNRHNRLHWADLAALDVVPASCLPCTIWPVPRLPGADRRVGLFVGASEAAKRPEAAFWAELARQLIRRGSNPVFLGGPEDHALAHAAAQQAGIPGANLAGRFSLEKFADFIRQLDLLVTPDTGPMHVGAWVQVPTLNLSMGPVNPWETAPAVPGHLVVRAEPSCAGCWQCTRLADSAAAPPCHAAFAPGRIAALIQAVLHHNTARLDAPGLRLLRTNRDERGLFKLEQADNNAPRARDLRGNFWREAFLALLGGPPHHLAQALEALHRADPRTPALIARFAGTLIRRLTAEARTGARTGARNRPQPGQELWLSVPPLLRPLSSYLQLELENADYAEEAWEKAFTLTRTLLDQLDVA